MKVRLCSFVLASFLVLGCCVAASASGPDQFQVFVETTHSARASFSQSVVSKSGRKAQVSQGTFAFSRPGKFRWTYEKPYEQLMVGDGVRLWIYDKDLNQVSVKKLGQAIGSSPAALLAGDTAAEKHFVIVDAGSSEGMELIEATPRSPDGGFERVRLGFRNNLPQLMEVHDNFGQVTTLRFERFERNPALAPELFRFVPPKGADVVTE
ncbi:MAG: outer membrane lipoprotein carrier protein LolA [Rhodocyclaceae bacterium]|nr:MAG: outer membrane lipoprotein carrier protein LolA [Rhodocyclaceae bacterium]